MIDSTSAPRIRNGKPLSHRLLCGASLAAVLACAPLSARAEDRYWDANSTAVGSGGTGTWNLANLNWSPNGDGVSGPFVEPWINGDVDNAIFGGTAGIVTVGVPVTIGNITFSSAGYTLSGSTINLAGTNPTITTAGTNTINSVLAGSSGLTKAGGGTLILNGVNTFTGTVNLNAGGINAATDAALGASSNNIVTGAGASVALSISGVGTNRSIHIGDGGTLTLAGSGGGSALVSGNGTVAVGNGVTMSNDANSYTGRTTFRGINGVANFYFTSIGNLGEASSLGAPVTVENGTIFFNQSSQYSDNVIYLGDGDSSNRNWETNGASALVRNRGTGTLSLTGDIVTAGGSGFYAEGADIELLGVLSGGNYSFSAGAGRVITLGGANTFTGLPAVGGLVKASVLADIGAVSSLGAGSNITLSAGVLSYVGTGSSSNRIWSVSGDSAILNDGSGALALSGATSFTPGNPVDRLTLGGDFAGVNTYSGIISGAGDLIGNGTGTWVLGGANTFVGNVTVNSGTLQAGNTSAFGAATGFVVNGGTLALGGYDLTAPSLTGTGGVVDLGASILTVEAKTAQTYAGIITGTGQVRKAGAGTLTLTGANSYSGATTVSGGKLALDFSGAASPADNIISASSPLILSGGTLEVLGAAGETNNQTFGGLTVNAGSNIVRAINGAGGTVNLNLGAISRNGGLVNFVLPTAGVITTSNADGVLGGWATINGSDYAKVVGGGILAFNETDYTNKDDAGTWVSGDIISDTANAVNTPFFGTVGSNVQLGGLRYTSAAGSTVTIGAGNTLGIDGTIIVAPDTLAANQTLTGGSVTGGSGGGTLGVQQNGTGTFTIASTIVDNGGTSFVKGGAGTVRLTGMNSYQGATTLSGGRLAITNLADGGLNSSIGASTADSSNLILESGTLAYVGATDVVTNRGFTLVNGGSERAIEIDPGRTVEFSGLVTSPDDAGLNKTGAGTLVLSNDANDYVGGTTVSGGDLSVDTLVNGGVASGIGASSSASSNLLLQTGGTLRYTGATATTDRGFSLAGTGGGGIDVADAGTVLAFSGVVEGNTGALMRKEGAGTLVLAGVNTYTGATSVQAGTLRAGSNQAFGTASLVTLADTVGVTLDLAGFNNKIGGLSGGGATGGTVLLGGATLTVGGSNASFSGIISGTGGLTKENSSTQAIVGCRNDYTGVTTILGGTLSVDCLADGGAASGIGAASASPSNLVLAGGNLTYTGGSASTDRGFTIQSGLSTITVGNALTTLEISGQATGAGQFQKAGAGTLILSGNNNYTGAANVLAGVLRAGSGSAFGAGTGQMTLADAAGVALDLNDFDVTLGVLNGGGALGGNVLLGSGTLTLSNGTAFYSGAISGNGGIVKSGSGTQVLNGCGSSYTGSTVVNGGVLAVECLTDGGANSGIGASSADAGNLVLNGGTFQYRGAGGSTDRQFTLGGSAALDSSFNTGPISFTSTAAIALTGTNLARTLTLSGTNTDNNSLAAQITDNGTGATSLTKSGTGTWVLTNSGSTYTGITRINGGVLGVDKLSDGGVASSIGASSAAASNLVIGNGSTLRYTGSGDTTNRLFTLAAGTSFIESSGTGAIVFTDTGPVTLAGNNQARTIALGGTNTGNNTLAGSIGDAGTGATTLAKNDSGTWVLTGNNTFSGNTVINDGNLIIGNGGTTGNAGTGNVFVTTSTSTLSFNRSDAFNFTGTISGPGSIAQIGTGTTVLTATNSIGAARVDDGTLQVNGALRTATFAMNGDGALTVNGTVEGAAAGTISSFAGDAGASTIVVNAGGTLRASGDLGGGSDSVTLTGALVTGGAGLSLGAGDDIFTLRDGGVITGTGINGGTGTDSLVVVNTAARILDGGSITAFESLTKQSGGLLTLTGDHSYANGTTIAAGTLRIGNGGASGTLAGDIANNSALEFDRTGTLTIAGEISGAGSVNQLGSGTTILTADNAYTGGTTITAGTLQLGSGGASGFITGDVANEGSLIFNRSDDVGFGGLISGSGSLAQNGSGIVTLTAANSYGGATTVNAGTLLVNGDQSGATGLTSVASGATLGGIGTIGGNVAIAGGGTLAAGSNGAGMLTINGNLALGNSSQLNFEFGQANVPGGPLNDLVNVGGDLTLDGTLNVTQSAGGTFGPGVYRMFNYAGALTDNGVTVGSPEYLVQTSVANQVNLINSAGLTLSFWDGDAEPHADGIISGGSGTWRAAGDANWTDSTGVFAAPFANASFAIFQGAPGTVAIDNANGQVEASGMQFAANGYTVQGGALTLVDDSSQAGLQSVIRVGDGTAAGAGYTATIASDIAGATQLVKTDAGTLILSGTNIYTGGTAINGGTVQISSNANLGDFTGGLSFNGGTLHAVADVDMIRAIDLAGAGTFDADAAFVTLRGVISGGGTLTKEGNGTLALLANNSYSAGTTIAEGILQVGNGGTTGSILGDVVNNGSLLFARSDSVIFGGTISGSGTVVQSGTGVLTFTADNSYTGITTIRDGFNGALQLGNGGTTGSVAGDVENGGTLIFNRSNEFGFAGTISGTGAVRQEGTGTTILTAANSYTGSTIISSGTLLVNGNQTAAVGTTNVLGGGTLGGIGTIGGDVFVGGGATLTPGDATGPGTLTINGNLGFSPNAVLAYQFGQSNVIGGPLNDLTEVAGDLALDGTIDVAVSPGGSFGPGLYRVISYGGALTDDGLNIGAMPAGSTVAVQTAIDGQVNLVNAAGGTFNFWDGAAPANESNNAVDGGDGTWQNSSGNNDWTITDGSVSGAYTDGTFAIFAAAAGTVDVDNSLGAVTASGLQFATDGYTITGQDLTLVGPQSIIRVGDGTAAGLGMTATVDAGLIGATQLVKDDLGTLVLTGTNSYTGGTLIDAGTLRIASDANLGDAAGALTLDAGTLNTTADIVSARDVTLTGTGTFVTDAGTTLVFTGALTGAGDLIKDGAGALALNDVSSHSGATTIRAGSLFVNGDLSLATGLTSAASGATLGGSGVIGGNVAVADGATLAAGTNGVGTLTINGNLALAGGSVLDFEFGEANVAGGSLNDLVEIGGDLTLDGTINVTVPASGSFGPGIYRVFNYGGALTDNGLVLGAMPGGSTVSVQTAVAGQVNLVNTAGLTLSFWDGNAGPKNDGTVNGGNGTWRVGGGSSNWTDANGVLNADYAQNSFAIFSATPGTVTIDDVGGPVEASGLQFASDGYTVTGDALTLTGGQAIVQVGDGSAASTGYTATIASEVTGTAGLVKTDAGTLVLTAANSYSGGTTIDGGTLQIGNGGTTGSIIGDIDNNGTLAVNRSDAIELDGTISGTGSLTKRGGGVLTLTGTNSYSGGTLIDGGTVQVTSDANLGNVAGVLSLQGGTLRTGASFASSRGVLLGGADANNIDTQGFDVTLSGVIGDGPNNNAGNFVNKLGLGTLTLTGANTYSNRTVIAGGTLAVAGAGTIGSGNLVVASGTVFDISQADVGARVIQLNAGPAGTIALGSKTVTLGFGNSSSNWSGTITDGGIGGGTGGSVVVMAPNGAVRFSEANSYTGGTTVAAGSFELAGNGSLYSGGAVTVNGGGVFSIAGLTGTGTTIGDLSGAGVVALGGKTLTFGTGNDTALSGTVSGSDGSLVKTGAGTFTLSGANSYTGLTDVTAGTLLVNGDQSAATGLTSVFSGATLGGTGTIGGDVVVADGATLAPGAGGAGTLTINGDLSLGSGSSLAFEFGRANAPGDPLNDVVNVGGDLALDGTLNVAVTPGGAFDIGLYRVANYGGTLTDNGLALGALPAGADVLVQTSVANQVNLVNVGGATLNFWDGALGPKFNGAVNGGNGVWQAGVGNDNWADATGAVNAGFDDGAFAIFTGAAGTITIDNGLGGVNASGLQFAVDGYTIGGDVLTLTDPQSVVRVGDGSAGGAAYTATIDAELTGNAQLVKTDLGTLVLTGTNSYTGGTAINGGTLRISSDANLGDVAGAISFDGGTLASTADMSSAREIALEGSGTFVTEAGTTLTISGAIAGAGNLTKRGAGTLALTGTGTYAGGATVASGTLLVNGDYAGATGATSVAAGGSLGGTGTIGGDVSLANGATLTPGAGGAGTLTIGGSLSLAAGTTLAYEFGQAGVAGGALNDLVNIGGDLVLDGTINVSVPAGGAFDVGVYRVFNYGGALTDNGLALGTLPGGTNAAVQTSIAGQVNLVNSAGLTLNFWDGAAGPKNNGAIDGGNGTWQNSTGNDSWTDSSGNVNAAYSDGAFAVFGGIGGTVTVDNGLGQVTAAGMQFAADGYTISGDEIALTGPQSTIRVGDGSTVGAGFTATITAALSGDTQLVKTDAGTLVLSGANSYTGGTRIAGGTIRIASDANLGASTGGVSLDGGTLETSNDLTSARAIEIVGTGAIATADATTFAFDGLLSGSGDLTKAGTGTLSILGNNEGFGGSTTVAAGILAVQGRLGGAVTVGSAGRLEGEGRVGSITNAGVVAPGASIGALTVAGDYAGNGGILEIDAELGGDASATDRLVVNGATSGTTAVTVINRGGLGAQTVEGIKIVDVAGDSNGSFVLDGDYLFDGEQAVIAGAYGYRLYKDGVATPQDGDWYLRSTLLNASNEPQGPLYQPGVPLYENYGQVLASLNALPTLQERVGNRQWARSDDGASTGIWGRMESTRARPEARVSTAGTDANIDSWKMQIGADLQLSESENGSLVAGVTGHYGESNASVRSMFGDGSIKAKGYGAGATLTWYHRDGFYADAQAQFSWFDGSLNSSVLGTLVDGNGGTGKALSLELGKRTVVGGGLTVTPQIQMSYHDADFDSFTDPSEARISSAKGDSLKSRWGISLDHQKEWASNGTTRRSHLYGLVNLSYEWLDGTVADVSGTAIHNANDRLWGEIALGGSLGLNDRVTIYTQASASSPFRDFGDDYSIKGTAGVRVAF